MTRTIQQLSTMKSHTRTLSAVTGIGIVTFIAVVVLLHWIQPRYDARLQFISELALGRLGDLLMVAFLGLSIATAATAVNLRACHSSLAVPSLLALAAVCFLVAGIITLGISVQTHVLLVATAFVACGLGMYLLPRTVSAFAGLGGYLASWGSGIVMCGATGLANSVISSGIAQRISALALLFWLSYVAWRLARGKEP
jgi:hypothetical protein